MRKKVILIGDSIRMGYQSLVREKIGRDAVVKSPKQNCGNSFRLREHLDEWVISHRPEIIHFNAGIHDMGWMPEETVSRFTTSGYARNLRIIIDRLQRETTAELIFATTTPFLIPISRDVPNDQCKIADIVERYNRAALKVMESKSVAVNDLYQVIISNDVFDCICDDKIHMTSRGNEVLSDAVVEQIAKHL